MGDPKLFIKRTQIWQFLTAIAVTVFLVIAWISWVYYFYDFKLQDAQFPMPFREIIFVVFGMMFIALMVGTCATGFLYKSAAAWKHYLHTSNTEQLKYGLQWQRYFFVTINLLIVLLLAFVGLFFLLDTIYPI